MKRALIAIGCNSYDHLDLLGGAEKDAQRVFSELTKEDIGNYSPAASRLLFSPTLAELNATLQSCLSTDGGLDTFTFYFAGHGIVVKTGFYLCLRDTRVDQASPTGFWLSQLFSMLAEVGPAQTNIVLDACCSGGLALDLSVLTKADIMGDAGSPAVTLLAMAARNQEASEDDSGGIGTNALLDCITGQAFVQDTTAALDLMDIGRFVSSRVAAELDQNPCLTALNAHQRSIFCRNPHYQASVKSAFDKWTPRAFLDAIEPVLASHSHSSKDLLADIDRLTGGLIERAKESPDCFREHEVRSTAAVALLEYCGTQPQIDEFIIQQSRAICALVSKSLSKANEAIRADKYALLGRRGGLGDLFVLPQRISKLLGWAGATYHLSRAIGNDALWSAGSFKELLSLLVAHYALSISVVSDLQAPYMALALTAAAETDCGEDGETVLSLLYNSVVSVRGHLFDGHLEPERILQYLVARQRNSFENALAIVARPSEAITVLLKSASRFGLEDVFDEAMEGLDHTHLNAYVADDYSRFAKKNIEGGENANFRIGHDVWRISDLEAAWPPAAVQRPANRAIICGAILSALVFPDRVPWFLFSPQYSSAN